jgi:hypothetical protein
MTTVIRPETIFALITLLTAIAALDATLQRFEKSPRLYYDNVGKAQLYNTEWKLLTYVDLQEADRNFKLLLNRLSYQKNFVRSTSIHFGLISLIVCEYLATLIGRIRKYRS